MLFKFYQNTVAAISQWLETVQFGARPEPVRIRIEQATPEQQIAAIRQQRRLAARYRR